MHSLMWFDPRLDAYHSWKYRRLRAKWRFLVGPIVRHAHRILCVSDYLADEYARVFGADRRKLFTVGNGVEEEYFAPVEGDPPVPQPYVVSISGLTYIKGADHQLDVAAQLARLAPGLPSSSRASTNRHTVTGRTRWRTSWCSASRRPM